jgi:hypothetical protein
MLSAGMGWAWLLLTGRGAAGHGVAEWLKISKVFIYMII